MIAAGPAPAAGVQSIPTSHRTAPPGLSMKVWHFIHLGGVFRLNGGASPVLLCRPAARQRPTDRMRAGLGNRF
jgi:hypothetical protein